MPGPWHYEDDAVQIRKLCVGPLENNAYVLACVATGKAVLIDAAAEPHRLYAGLAGVDPIGILTTHGHADHVGAAAEVRDALGIPFMIHPRDADLAGVAPDAPLLPGPISVGRVTVEAMHTPGHTPGSVCFKVSGVVFTGDTLFPGGPGATRGSGQSFAEIMTSIEESLFTMPDRTLVFPGHGLDTTIGTERPALPEWRERGW